MSARRSVPRCSLLWCALSLLALCRAAGAGPAPALEGTPEWIHLSTVWNTLTDHSAGLALGQERLHELVPEMDRAEAGLTALVTRKALPAEMAAALRTVLQERYRYIEEHCYGPSTRREMTALEGAEAASRWIVEMQLDLLRQSAASGSLTVSAGPDPKLQQAVRASLVSELSFLRQCRAARDELGQQRDEIDKRERQGKKVDRNLVDVAWARQQQALVESHQEHRVRADRTIEHLVPYLIRLTLTRPPQPQADEYAAPPLFPF